MLLFFLSVISTRAMLAVKVLLDKQRIHGQIGVDRIGYARHFSHLLHNHCVVYSVMSIFAPCKRTVILHQNTRSMHGIYALETLDYDITGLKLVFALDLLFGHVSRTGYGVMEVVGMGRAYVGQVYAGLRPCGGIGGVSVHHTPLFREMPCKGQDG